MSFIRNQFFSASTIYPDFTAASFFVFIFRALRPCDQDSPISEWKPVYLFIRKENTSFPSFRREKHLKVKKARVFEEQAIKKSDAREEEVLGW